MKIKMHGTFVVDIVAILIFIAGVLLCIFHNKPNPMWGVLLIVWGIWLAVMNAIVVHGSIEDAAMYVMTGKRSDKK